MLSVLKERSNKNRQQHIAKPPHIDILIELITKKSFLHKKIRTDCDCSKLLKTSIILVHGINIFTGFRELLQSLKL